MGSKHNEDKHTCAHTVTKDSINILSTLTYSDIFWHTLIIKVIAFHTPKKTEMLHHIHGIIVKSLKKKPFCVFPPPADKSTSVWLLPITGHWHTDACGEHFIWCRQIIAYTFWNNVTHGRVHTLAAQHKGKYGCILLFSFWSRRLTCSWQEICRQSLHRAKQTRSRRAHW